MPNKINTIIFDYAGVITPTQGFDDFIEIYKDELQKTKEEFYYYFKKNWSNLSIGQGKPNTYWKDLSIDLGLSIEETREKVLGTFPLNRNVLSIIKELKNSYTTVLMSNQIDGWIEDELLPERISNYFTHNFSSYIIGIKKPHPEAYDYMLKELNISGSECLYFDDQEENLKSASALGIKGIQFFKNSDIKLDLAKFNIMF